MIMQGSHMSLEQIAADLLGVFLVWLPYALQMKCSEEMIFSIYIICSLQDSNFLFQFSSLFLNVSLFFGF